MRKFSIESIIIEKSTKDINTGVLNEFSDGINLICGNNEAGKSSLLAFIRQGFFKVKGVDKGKINFKITDETGSKHYRTDIQDNRLTDLRCKLYDENNTPVNYSFIEEVINKKYFEQGFTINLDDLMNIQNKDTEVLVNTIKDPSGEKLSSLLEKIKNDSKKILGDNNRLTKETSGILDKIKQKNLKISELSNLEAKYNSAVEELKDINKQLEQVYKQEEFAVIKDKELTLTEKIFDIKEQRDVILSKYNERLVNNQQKYTQIIQNSGKIEANLNILQKNSDKIEQLNSKIYMELNHLKTDFSFNPEIDDIKAFNVDYNIIRQIKELNIKKSELINELTLEKHKYENLEENLLKLKHELCNKNTNEISEEEFEKLKSLYDFLEENTTKITYLQTKINNIDKSMKLNAKSITSSNILFVLLIILFIMTITIAFLCFYNHVPEAGIFAVIMAVLLFPGIIAIKISNLSDSEKNDIKQTENLLNDITAVLKEHIKDYYKEIDSIEPSYFPYKVENIKTEIKNKIQNYVRIKEIISKNESEIAYNQDKINMSNDKMIKLQSEIDKTEGNINSLIQSMNNNLIIPTNIYLEIVEIIEKIKENIDEVALLTNHSAELEEENDYILKEFNDFISEVQINLSFGKSHTDNIQILKSFNDANLELKNNIEILNNQMEGLNEQIKILNEKQLSIGQTIQYIPKEEIERLKQEIIDRKKDSEYKKRNLEEFEGLSDLKIEKEVLLHEFRKKIFTLAKNKMILQITKTAQESFDKVQPDLKNAQHYLSILTEGKYNKINLDLEEISNGNITKKWNELSRGTKEQVYLALRLGYASNYTTDRVSMISNGKADLPLIIDDAFVNFDEIRTRQAIKCLIDFSKNNQILFFTCHGQIMKKHFEELCKEKNVNLNVINIG